MTQMRLFIGLQFSERFSKDLEPWVKKIKKTADQKEMSLKWVPSANYHVTLVFLGNTSPEEVPGIGEKMRKVAQEQAPFDLKVRHIGGFPTVNQARVIYMDIQRSQAILDLQSALEREFKSPDQYEAQYTPHLTLARLRNPKSCRDLLSPFEHADLGRQTVREIVLFKSTLAGSFPVYEKLIEVPLNPVIELSK